MNEEFIRLKNMKTSIFMLKEKYYNTTDDNEKSSIIARIQSLIRDIDYLCGVLNAPEESYEYCDDMCFLEHI